MHVRFTSVTAPCSSSFLYMYPSPVSVFLLPDVSVYKQSRLVYPSDCPLFYCRFACINVSERTKAGCCIVALARLQPDIPAFPFQTTNSSYHLTPVLLLFSICTCLKFPSTPPTKHTELPFLPDF